jgi:predicted nuclease of predicted toxin-antitoxin system
MKFLLDESFDYPLAAVLTNLGHDVTAIAYDYPMSLKDRDILTIANQEGRVLITNDRDFGELIVRHKLPHSGVILFRLKAEDLTTKTKWLTHVLNNYSHELANFIIVSERGVRVRTPS